MPEQEVTFEKITRVVDWIKQKGGRFMGIGVWKIDGEPFVIGGGDLADKRTVLCSDKHASELTAAGILDFASEPAPQTQPSSEVFHG